MIEAEDSFVPHRRQRPSTATAGGRTLPPRSSMSQQAQMQQEAPKSPTSDTKQTASRRGSAKERRPTFVEEEVDVLTLRGIDFEFEVLQRRSIRIICALRKLQAGVDWELDSLQIRGIDSTRLSIQDSIKLWSLLNNISKRVDNLKVLKQYIYEHSEKQMVAVKQLAERISAAVQEAEAYEAYVFECMCVRQKNKK
jgi:hypothetical protein